MQHRSGCLSEKTGPQYRGERCGIQPSGLQFCRKSVFSHREDFFKTMVSFGAGRCASAEVIPIKKKDGQRLKMNGYILFFCVYFAAFLIALLFLRHYLLLVSPYQPGVVDPDYVEWFVHTRKALAYEDTIEFVYTCLNYLAMFAELVVFLEIFLKKENRRRLSWKLIVPALMIDGAAYLLFFQYAKGAEHCSLYMPMVPWALLALTFTVFLAQIQKKTPPEDKTE